MLCRKVYNQYFMYSFHAVLALSCGRVTYQCYTATVTVVVYRPKDVKSLTGFHTSLFYWAQRVIFQRIRFNFRVLCRRDKKNYFLLCCSYEKIQLASLNMHEIAIFRRDHKVATHASQKWRFFIILALSDFTKSTQYNFDKVSL